MTGSLRDLLAAVAGEHHADPAYLNTCICEVVWVSSQDTTHYAAHLADVQAAAVDGWLSGLRETVALGIAGTQKPCRKAIEANGGCQQTAGYGSCYCADEADAALAAIREQIGGVS